MTLTGIIGGGTKVAGGCELKVAETAAADPAPVKSSISLIKVRGSDIKLQCGLVLFSV